MINYYFYHNIIMCFIAIISNNILLFQISRHSHMFWDWRSNATSQHSALAEPCPWSWKASGGPEDRGTAFPAECGRSWGRRSYCRRTSRQEVQCRGRTTCKTRAGDPRERVPSRRCIRPTPGRSRALQQLRCAPSAGCCCCLLLFWNHWERNL